MYKFLVFSDLHLHTWNYGSSIINGRNSRLLFQQAALIKMINYADTNNIEDIYFCGDFFHTHSMINSEVLHAAWEIFEEQPTYKYKDFVFLMGNHDMTSSNRSVSALNILNGYGHVATQFQSGPFSTIFIPFVESKDELLSYMDKIDANGQPVILFMHQGVANVPVNSTGFTINEILTPDMLPSCVSAAFTGHYHSHKQVNEKLWIPGSVNQLTWVDIGEKRGWLDVEVNGSNVKVTHIESQSPKFIYKTHLDILNDIRGSFVRIDCPAGTDVNALREEAQKYSPLSLEIRVAGEKPEHIDTPKNVSSIIELFHEYIECNSFSPEFIKAGKDIINASN